MNRFVFATMVTFGVLVTPARASVPQEINFQGQLQNPLGTPVPNGNYVMTFAIYNAATGGAALWSEAHSGANSVPVANGLYNVRLGSISSITLQFDASHWLGVSVGTDPEMTPRLPLTSVPYAFRAETVPDGSISTAKLAPFSVTSSGQATGGTVLIGSSPTTLVSLAQATAGGAVLVLFSCTLTAPCQNSHTVMLRVDGSNVATTMAAGVDGCSACQTIKFPASLQALATPGSGAHTFDVVATGTWSSCGQGSASSSNLTIVELKR